MFFRHDIRATGVVFHEFYHVSDYYYGIDSYYTNTFGKQTAKYILEFNTYLKVYNRFGVGYDGLKDYSWKMLNSLIIDILK